MASSQIGPWELIDPELKDPALAQTAHKILDLVDSDWQADVEINTAEPAIGRLLTRHRIWPVIPLDRVPLDQREDVRQRHAVIAGAQLRIMSTAIEVLQVLAGEGIDTRVLKGMATAELDYPDRHFRQSGDIDIALPHGMFEQAVRALKAHGYRNHSTSNSNFLLKGTTLDAPNRIEVDIHTRLFQRSPLSDKLFADPGDQLSELPGKAHPPAQRLVHAAGHFILTPPGFRRLSGFFDITRILRRPDLRLEDARAFAAALGVERLVGAGIRIEATLSDRTDVLADLDTWQQPDWLERNTRLVPERRLGLDHLSRFREVPRDQWVRYLPTWLLPDRRQRGLLRQAIVKRRPW